MKSKTIKFEKLGQQGKHLAGNLAKAFIYIHYNGGYEVWGTDDAEESLWFAENHPTWQLVLFDE